MDFKDKVVIITGGAQGIGKAIAEEFCKRIAKVVLFDVNQEVLDITIKELKEFSEVIGMKVDVISFEEVQKNVNKVIDKFKRVDILVNNAGITRDNLILRLSEKEWERVISVNLTGVFNCTKVVTKQMVRQRYGRIVNISSVVGLMGNVGQVNYAASKAGLIGFTKSLAKELGSRKVTVNAVAPGYIDTAMTQQLDGELRQKILEQIPLRRFGTPQDVAKAVLFLASDDAEYITGQVLVVDGGFM